MSAAAEASQEAPPKVADAGADAGAQPKVAYDKEKLAAELAQLIHQAKPLPKIGLSNAAKKVKDELADDPYNMKLILQLGTFYADAYQWEQCANVMLRGWKRVEEFKDPRAQFDFLVTLAQASLQCNKAKQALAVLQDVEDPTDKNVKEKFEILRCKVYCENGDTQKAMKAFNAAIDGQAFDNSSAIWGSLLRPLKKVGAYDLSRSAVLEKAKDEAEGARLETMEKLSELKDGYVHGDKVCKADQWKEYARNAGIVVLVLLVCFVLHFLESRNLEMLKIRK